MKKKYRDITVNSIKYAWNIISDDEGNSIQVFKDRKKIISLYKCGNEPVTPKIIEQLIKTNGTTSSNTRF